MMLSTVLGAVAELETSGKGPLTERGRIFQNPPRPASVSPCQIAAD